MNTINIQMFSEQILSILLLDHTTNKNILWATEDYANKGISSKSQIQLSQILGANPKSKIESRTQKQKSLQSNRTKEKAEVFTPAWVCNSQNNLIDEAWFGRNNVFNVEENKTWHTTKQKIIFDEKLESKKTWQDYVNATRLEITCGEAPYLVSPYDAANGKDIPLKKRIGLLDRKMRVVKENVQNESEYFLWTKIAFQNCYGFELQGDSLLIARINLLFTFIENTKNHLHCEPSEQEQVEIAKIISWNLWQMDGLTFKTPFSSANDDAQNSLFEEFNETENFPCKIKDWKENKIIEYRTLVKKRG